MLQNQIFQNSSLFFVNDTFFRHFGNDCEEHSWLGPNMSGQAILLKRLKLALSAISDCHWQIWECSVSTKCCCSWPIWWNYWLWIVLPCVIYLSFTTSRGSALWSRLTEKAKSWPRSSSSLSYSTRLWMWRLWSVVRLKHWSFRW